MSVKEQKWALWLLTYCSGRISKLKSKKEHKRSPVDSLRWGNGAERQRQRVSERGELYRERTLETSRRSFWVFRRVLTVHTKREYSRSQRKNRLKRFQEIVFIAYMGQEKVFVVYYLKWLFYLKVDCDQLNVYTINPKVATKVTVITKKKTKKIKNGIIKKKSQRTQKEGMKNRKNKKNLSSDPTHLIRPRNKTMSSNLVIQLYCYLVIILWVVHFCLHRNRRKIEEQIWTTLVICLAVTKKKFKIHIS